MSSGVSAMTSKKRASSSGTYQTRQQRGDRVAVRCARHWYRPRGLCCRYRGGVYPTGKLPPCVCFVLFSYFAFPHDHQRPSQTTETVHNCFSGPSLDRRNVLCGERAVLHRFLRFSRALSLESSLSAHSCRLIKRKSKTSCLGRSFDHRFYARVKEPRSFSPSASRSYSSYSFVAFDELSGLTTTRSGEPH